ncbi:PLAT domain-containing protein 3-like [Chenopodium quinoa]|uniref:PLAT domain-containing protein n=1 Tax=Chenopodium quinoa TaxID=63459 RepID=A0A803MB83_CHEQI|nr:PLAT domain-containing protein 3-like [Chenopodium quinoa]
MATKHILSSSLILLSLFIFGLSSVTADDYECVYTVYVRTSKAIRGGTDANISTIFYDDTGSGILIKNLEAWGGLMGPDHDYFERGNLDIFSGRGPCLNGPICSMVLTSDGSVGHHGTADWYCNYVEVTTTGPHAQCAQQLFTVEQWLSPPDQLSAVVDNCKNNHGLKRRRPANALLPVETLLAASSSSVY